ncbi:hypothetical protein [Dysosmobacter sp.]|uniref:hypothetical protein n=1 Tax=Dysosmobacter sp. TaxID=2591382 RepID=UPI002A98D003|nr:hypothetical protein [Dysosmobacter sp.]MDY5613222.1 hypothetical protein [Dysosmobacter sp.]
MRRVQCHECGKRYNYDMDDFCPRCGAFTQPSKTIDIGADGTVIRVEGINEENHRNSFVHAELHAENRKRRGTDLEAEEILRRGTRPTFRQPARQSRQGAGKKNPAVLVFWIVFAVIAFNILSQIFYIFL